LFKGDSKEETKILHVHRMEYYMFGKDPRVCDVPLLHPSVSKQHAVLQYRLRDQQVVPYLLDLESTNGTFLNGNKLDACRYYELREGDALRFGRSTREFILLHDKSEDTM